MLKVKIVVAFGKVGRGVIGREHEVEVFAVLMVFTLDLDGFSTGLFIVFTSSMSCSSLIYVCCTSIKSFLN